MSLLNNPERTVSSQNPSLHAKSKLTHQGVSFEEKLREVRSIFTLLLPQEKQQELQSHLDELHEIYLNDLQGNRPKVERSSDPEGEQGRTRRSEKIILEVREGAKLVNEVKIEGRVKSPERKGEEKKFVRFQPKKVKGGTTGLGNILKNG